jgi:hypothetical protein
MYIIQKIASINRDSYWIGVIIQTMDWTGDATEEEAAEMRLKRRQQRCD